MVRINRSYLALSLFAGVALVSFFPHSAFGAAAPLSDQALAASSQVILTWNASSFHPSLYPGRVLPSPKSSFAVTASMLTGGKFADLSNRTVTWYENEDRIQSGTGLTAITITTNQDAGTNEVVRAEVAFGTSTVSQSVVIPIAPPSVVIEIPYPGGQVKAGSQISLRATPFFFNISSLSDLIFYWQIGDIKKNMGSSNSISLSLGALPGGSSQTISVSSYVQSKRDLTNIIKTDTSIGVH